MGKIIFITGTDTGVGKTLLTGFLLHHLRRQKIRALAMKPFCTGDQGDVKCLQKFQRGALSDSEVNPYFFPEPIAPFIAAKLHRKRIEVDDVLKKISALKKKCDLLFIEGAGGLMVPLGNGFTVCDLISKLGCPVLIVAQNKLGVINHTALTIGALQNKAAKELTVVLMDPERPDSSWKSNAPYIRKAFPAIRLFRLPRLYKTVSDEKNYKKIKKTLAAILKYDSFPVLAGKRGREN